MVAKQAALCYTWPRNQLLSAQNEENADVLASNEIWMEHTEIKFCNLELPENAGILLWLYAETNNGLTMMQPATGWVTDSAGKLRSTTVQ